MEKREKKRLEVFRRNGDRQCCRRRVGAVVHNNGFHVVIKLSYFK